LSLPSPHELYRMEPEPRPCNIAGTLRRVYAELPEAWRAKAAALRAVGRADEAAEAEGQANELEAARRQA
jgi:hypothetical protein